MRNKGKNPCIQASYFLKPITVAVVDLIADRCHTSRARILDALVNIEIDRSGLKAAIESKNLTEASAALDRIARNSVVSDNSQEALSGLENLIQNMKNEGLL